MEVGCLLVVLMAAQHLEAPMGHHLAEGLMGIPPQAGHHLELLGDLMQEAQPQEALMGSHLPIPMVPLSQDPMELGLLLAPTWRKNAEEAATPNGNMPPGVDPEAFSWFQTVDADHSGYISIKELKQALVNSNWSAFNDETCLMMINMFDKTKSGRIDVFAFSALWRFIQQWKNLFQQYDRDRSGSINFSELQQGETRGNVAGCREQAGGSILRRDSTVPTVVPVPTSCSRKPYGVCSGDCVQIYMTAASVASVQGNGGRINRSVLAWLSPT
ncbi:hypothetical protein KIL84_021425 [Mauremys mutica]|uniref:Peflin n=1 Tax=Mauremys mutica TaxID=74926 RepID=A0A9D3X858_9SAUR|nr:hypothetical protein KIL84_021425 [Mauremys mutica]